jgi:hypothetical protein
MIIWIEKSDCDNNWYILSEPIKWWSDDYDYKKFNFDVDMGAIEKYKRVFRMLFESERLEDFDLIVFTDNELAIMMDFRWIKILKLLSPCKCWFKLEKLLDLTISGPFIKRDSAMNEFGYKHTRHWIKISILVFILLKYDRDKYRYISEYTTFKYYI